MAPRACRMLLALACLAATATAAMSVTCPNVPKAARHFDLNVTEGSITLPDGKQLKQLMYNSQQIGPTLVVDLGEEVSVDIKNLLPAGQGEWGIPSCMPECAANCVAYTLISVWAFQSGFGLLLSCD